MKRLFPFLIIILTTISVKANHITGGDIAYEYIGNNVYKIHLVLYLEGNSGPPYYGWDPGAGEIIYVKSASCGLNTSFGVSSSAYPVALNVYSDCSNTTRIATARYYTGTTTITSTCNDIVFYNTTCCRATGISNLLGGQNFLIAAQLDNTLGPNSSPIWNSMPLGAFCTNFPLSAPNSAANLDGDSVYYELVNALEDYPNLPCAYGPGFTGAEPLPVPVGSSTNLSGTTGILTANINGQGDYTIVIKASDYRFDSINMSYKLIGTSWRDVLYVLDANCSQDVLDGVKLSSATPGYNAGKSSISKPVVDLNCADDSISLKFTKQINYFSIAPDGSDFKIISPKGQVVPTVGATFPISVSSAGTEVINLHPLSPLCDSGTYKVVIQSGTDGDSIYTICGVGLNVLDTIEINVQCSVPHIVGNASPQAAVNEVYYLQYTSSNNHTTNWTVVNGTLVSGQGTDTVTVNYTISNQASALVARVNDGTCLKTDSMFFAIQSLEQNALDRLVVYPNPTRDLLTIELGSEVSNLSGCLYSISGEKIRTFGIQSQSFTLSLVNLPKAIYILELRTEEAIKHFRIVVE